MKKISGLLVWLAVACTPPTATTPDLPPIVVDTTPPVSVAQTAPQRPIRADYGQVIPTTPTTTTTLPNTVCREWYPTFLQAGWPTDLWPQAAALIYRESRCQPSAYNQIGRAHV